ncbi:MAG: SDR family NAD(P)-dependent oxidoreductase [Clostridia bacterium]|nr:SDR family NAD(P)-dependent oxidoreductase [Clostridia bacterium]
MRVLISGGSSGVGRALCEHLANTGHEVISVDVAPFAPARGIESYTADVTSEGALSDIARDLTERDITLDAIVSLAGIHTMTSFVEGDSAEMRRVMDVNLMGAMLLVKCFYPRLAPRGRVVIVTSEVASLSPMPFNGLYSVSKAALDTYADALGKELALLGQRVITVRPGAIATPLAEGSLRSTERLAEATVLYRGASSRFLTLTRRFMGKPIAPGRVAALIARTLTAKRPRAVYSINRNLGLSLMGILPQSLSRFILRKLLK